LTSLLSTKGLKSKAKKLAAKKIEFYHSWVLISEIETLSLPVKMFYLEKKRQIDEFCIDAEKISSQLKSQAKISEFQEADQKKLIQEMS
jgi:hypothetical protein